MLAGAGAEVTVRLIAVPRVLDSIRVRERRGELRFSGVVVDQQGLPVPDAEVVAEGLDNKLRTDSEGHFLVRNVKRGTCSFEYGGWATSRCLGRFTSPLSARTLAA